MTLLKNHVILVNEQDEWLGTAEKLTAHKKGTLHRAFSVFIMNSNGELLLQRRAVEWDPLESTCRHASLSIL